MLQITNTIGQSVSINAAHGQGLMFKHNGNCFVLMPKHLAGNGKIVSLSSEGPVVNGIASVYAPFWKGLDLSIGITRLGITARCQLPFSAISSGRLSGAANSDADLVRILPSGAVERIHMKITDTRYLDFDAKVLDPNVKVQEGISGSFLYIGTTPIGMAVRSADGVTVTCVRIEEIALNTARWLSDRGGSFGKASPAPASQRVEGDLPVTLLDAQTPGRGPSELADNVLMPNSSYVFKPEGPVRMVFEITGGIVTTLSRVVMAAGATKGVATPRAISVDVDSSDGGQPRWRQFWAGEMGPDGQLDTGPRAGTYAKRIQITITSAWAPGFVGLDTVSFR